LKTIKLIFFLILRILLFNELNKYKYIDTGYYYSTSRFKIKSSS
jgi:hypothetical protein